MWLHIDFSHDKWTTVFGKSNALVSVGDTGPRPILTISRVYGRRPNRAYQVSLWLDSGLPTGPD